MGSGNDKWDAGNRTCEMNLNFLNSSKGWLGIEEVKLQWSFFTFTQNSHTKNLANGSCGVLRAK